MPLLKLVFPLIISIISLSSAHATTLIDNTNDGTTNPTQNNGAYSSTDPTISSFIGIQTGSNAVNVTSLRFVASNSTATQTNVTVLVYALDNANLPTGNPLFQQTFQNVTIGAFQPGQNTPETDFVVSPTNMTLQGNTKYGIAYFTSSHIDASWFFFGVTPYTTSGGTTYLSSGYIANGGPTDLTSYFSLAFQLVGSTPTSPAPVSVPTLSEWSLIALAFMVSSLLFLNKRTEEKREHLI